MKSFIYTVEYKRLKIGRGASQSIYRVKNNIPEYLGTHRYDLGTTRGNDNECLKFLIENNHVPKSWAKPRTNYIDFSKLGVKYQLTEIY